MQKFISLTAAAPKKWVSAGRQAEQQLRQRQRERKFVCLAVSRLVSPRLVLLLLIFSPLSLDTLTYILRLRQRRRQ